MHRFDFFRLERRRERDEENGIIPKGNCQMDVEVEPYRTHLESEMCVSELQGKRKVVYTHLSIIEWSGQRFI